jgi:cation diffusion facilitator family transporter
MKESISSKFIPNYGDSSNPKNRAKYGYLEALVSIFGNVLLFLIKITLAFFVNSIGLAADALHSLSDVSSSGVVLFGFKLSKKEPDRKHPFGHGRAEHIATLIIAVLLITIGISFIQQSITRILNPEPLTNPDLAIITVIIVLFTALVKELMARYSSLISKKIESEMLQADAWHHRTDAISSIGVVIGIIGSYFGYFILDAIFGIFVSFIIIYVGIHLIKTSSDILIGTQPKKALIQKLQKLADSTPQINGIHSIYVHDYGHIKIITFHAEMNGELSLDEAHDIADKIEEKIRRTTHYFPVIHVEPTGIHNRIPQLKNSN